MNMDDLRQIREDSVQILIAGGNYALIDKNDYTLVSKIKWHLNSYGYATGKTPRGDGHKTIFMHRIIVNAPKGADTDHINGNTLDNRRSNLRICKHIENCRNQKIRKNNTSGVKGVYLRKDTKKWEAKIGNKYKMLTIGIFPTFQE